MSTPASDPAVVPEVSRLPPAAVLLRGMRRTGMLRALASPKLGAAAGAARDAGGGIAAGTAIWATRDPGRLALIDDLGSLSFGELWSQSRALASHLASEHRIGSGPTLALMCRNHRGFVEGCLAASMLGADLLALNTEFPGPQLAQALSGHEIGAVIHDEEFTPEFDLAGFSGARIVAGADPAPGRLHLEEIVSRDLPPPGRPEGRGRIVILSSGTTGAPKGAARPQSASTMLGALATLMDRMPFRTGSPVSIAPPLFHGLGLGLFSIAQLIGCPVVLRGRFDAQLALDDLERHQVRCLVGVPVILQRMLDADAANPRELPALRAMISAGAPLTPHLAERLQGHFGEILFNLYGSTEVGFAAIGDPRDQTMSPGSVGRAPVGATVQLLDDDRRPIGPGASGHIFVGSKSAFEGYTGGGSRETVSGLMNTGDLGHLGPGGTLVIDGREDDMIVSGGENVFPGEVEDALLRHPRVADAAVVGVEDEEFGQRLVAYVISGEAGEDEIRSHLREHLARYKLPRDIHFVDEFPRTASGKVIRRKLAPPAPSRDAV